VRLKLKGTLRIEGNNLNCAKNWGQCCTNVSKLSHKYYKMSLNCHTNDTKGTV